MGKRLTSLSLTLVAHTTRSLALALESIRGAGGGSAVELLRKESLAGLAPSAACRVLSHAYAAVVPITPLPYPPLPLAPHRPGEWEILEF